MTNARNQILREFGASIEGETNWPRPICPTCDRGHIGFGEPTTNESGETRHLHGEDWFDPEYIVGSFEARAVCENASCGQVVTALGAYKVVQTTDPNYERMEYRHIYQVEFFSPPLTLLPLPEEVPEAVREAVERAAKILFAEPGLAATALRTSVERFLTSEGIEARSPAGHFVNLDTRIKAWNTSASRKRAADLFLAVKWIGNEGTHEVSDLVVGDVVDGLEFIDEAFHGLYVGPDLDARAGAVNANKGRPKIPS